MKQTFSDHGIEVQGNETRVYCPQCTPERKKQHIKDLVIDHDKGVWFCHHCGWTGGLQGDYQQEQPKPQKAKAYKKPKFEPTQNGDDVLAWFAERGISKETVEYLQIGNALSKFRTEKGEEVKRCLQFPYFYKEQVVNIKSRTRCKQFKQEYNALKCFYNYDNAFKCQDDALIICEGECFTGETQVFTEKGWVRFDEYQGEKALAVGTNEFEKPLAIIKKQYDGKLIELSNTQRFSSLFTEKHEIITQDKNGVTHKKTFRETFKHYKIPRVIEFNGVGINLSNEQIALTLAVCADSKLDRRATTNSYAHFEFKKERKAKRLESLLVFLGIKYTSYITTYGYITFNFILPDYIQNKKIPQNWIVEASLQQRKFIIEEMVEWDGNRVKGRRQYEFSSKHLEESEKIQTIAHTCGYCSTIMKRKNQFGEWYKTSILLEKTHTSLQTIKIEEKDYKGKVYCVNVSTGAILVRHNGCIHVQGNCDAASFIEAGFLNVVSVPDGAPSPNTKNYTTKFDFLKHGEELINKFDYFILAVDDDEAGYRLEQELCSRLGIHKCKRVFYPEGCKDANDVLVKYGKSKLIRLIVDAKEYPIDDVQTFDDAASDLISMHYVSDVGYSLDLGINIDVLNIKLGQLTIVTGIPSHGKSTFVDNMLVSLWNRHELPCCIFSPENFPLVRYMKKLIQINSRKRFFDMCELERWEEIDKVRKGFFFLSPQREETQMNIDTLLERARALVFRHGIKILVLDPWNEIEHDQKSSEREDQYISKQLAKIKRFAHVNNVHVIIVAHPTKLQKNKDGGYDSPTAYDIAGGAMWRNKADNVLCIYRPDLKHNRTELLIQKIRYNENGKAGETLAYQYEISTNTYKPIF